jgi:hypothetical protein
MLQAITTDNERRSNEIMKSANSGMRKDRSRISFHANYFNLGTDILFLLQSTGMTSFFVTYNRSARMVWIKQTIRARLQRGLEAPTETLFSLCAQEVTIKSSWCFVVFCQRRGLKSRADNDE